MATEEAVQRVKALADTIRKRLNDLPLNEETASALLMLGIAIVMMATPKQARADRAATLVEAVGEMCQGWLYEGRS